jgi:hypothetical protein
MIEIRSYRRVFDLERRIYRVDRLRLNPGGVPVRGVLYFLALLLGALVFGGLPLLGAPARALPWYVRDLLGPGALATLLSLMRLDGRTFHLAARSLLGFCLSARRRDGLRPASPAGARWAPPPITMLPDGSDARLRRLRYRGPGAVMVMVDHRLGATGERRGRRRAMRTVQLSGVAHGSRLERGKVLLLERDARLLVKPGPRG